jgi:hypothetical protein
MHVPRRDDFKHSAPGKFRAYLADRSEVLAFAAILLVSILLGVSAWVRFLS